VLGCLLDMAPSILIVTPILLPVVMKFGVDSVHFGMIMLLNLGIGLCHPPVGAILFVGCAADRVTIEQVVREVWPFYGVMFFASDLHPVRLIMAAANARIVSCTQFVVNLVDLELLFR
jgi:TRAP-type C4-dicarboxylate transport system permease large subunit